MRDFTKNQLNDFSGLYSDPSNELTISLTNIQNNTANRCGLILIGSSNVNHIENINVLGNKQSENTETGLIHTRSFTIISTSVFEYNTGNPLFAAESSYNTNITFEGCTFDVELSGNVTSGDIFISGLPEETTSETEIEPESESSQETTSEIEPESSGDESGSGDTKPSLSGGIIAVIVIAVVAVVVIVTIVIICYFKKRNDAEKLTGVSPASLI